MGPLKFITQGFIDFFGITKPTPKEERQASWFIFALLAGIIVFAAAVFFIVVMAFGHAK
jgi:hypothetical protein